MTNKEKREKLIMEAADLENELGYIEYKLPFVLDKIKKLRPTKAELEDGLQDLFDTYI